MDGSLCITLLLQYRFFFIGSSDNLTEVVISEWKDEESDYDFNSNTCSNGNTCNAYKQVKLYLILF